MNMQNEILDNPIKDSENYSSSHKNLNLTLPGVVDRVKAAMFDMVLLVGVMFCISEVFTAFEIKSETTKMITFISIFGLYDPLFTSLFGGTVGHLINGLRVKKSNNHDKNIILPLAIIRFFIKICLGWISLLTIGGNSKSKAIHDMLVNSMVIYRKKKK